MLGASREEEEKKRNFPHMETLSKRSDTIELAPLGWSLPQSDRGAVSKNMEPRTKLLPLATLSPCNVDSVQLRLKGETLLDKTSWPNVDKNNGLSATKPNLLHGDWKFKKRLKGKRVKDQFGRGPRIFVGGGGIPPATCKTTFAFPWRCCLSLLSICVGRGAC